MKQFHPGRNCVGEAQIMIPRQFVGRIIGQKGATSIRIKNETGCNVRFPPKHRQPTDLSQPLPCTLTGKFDEIKDAEQMIHEIILRADRRQE